MLSVGSMFLCVFSVKLMVVLLIVSMIMLAKLMRIVIMIPSEMRPPVKVLYSVSFSYRSIWYELKKSPIFINYLKFKHILIAFNRILNFYYYSKQSGNLLEMAMSKGVTALERIG